MARTVRGRIDQAAGTATPRTSAEDRLCARHRGNRDRRRLRDRGRGCGIPHDPTHSDCRRYGVGLHHGRYRGATVVRAARHRAGCPRSRFRRDCGDDHGSKRPARCCRRSRRRTRIPRCHRSGICHHLRPEDAGRDRQGTGGDDPNGIIYDPTTHRVFSADRGSKRLTAIDARSGKIVATSVDLNGRTEHLAADDEGHVFLNMQDKGTMLKLNGAGDLKVLETWSLGSCGQPSSMDIDRAHRRVFVGCRSGELAVVNADNGKVVARQPIGPGVDALEFDSAHGLVFVSTGGGTGVLSIFHQDGPDAYSLVENMKTLPGARTMALDHKTGQVYLPVADVGAAPAPTPENPRPRAPMIPGSFSVLVVGR